MAESLRVGSPSKLLENKVASDVTYCQNNTPCTQRSLLDGFEANHLHQLCTELRRLCTLFYKLIYYLELDIPFDVGDQALQIFVMASEAIAQDKKVAVDVSQGNCRSTLKAELHKLLEFVDEVLSLQKVKEQEESLEMEKMKSSLYSLLQNIPSDISATSRTWAQNVFFILGLDHTKFDKPDIINCTSDELAYLRINIQCMWEEEFPICDIECDPESLVKSLQVFGYSVSTSKDIVSSVPEAILKYQSSLYWSKRYLRYKFFNDPLLIYTPRYPFQDTVLNEWFKEMNEDWQVNMINVSSEEGHIKLERFLKEHSGDNKFELFYHGTAHAYARMILNRGIELHNGFLEQDFSSRNGFYLSDNFQEAKQWAAAGRGQYQAVIVYKLNLTDWTGGLTLKGDEEEWQKIVNMCRTPELSVFERVRYLGQVKFVRGPACINPIAAVKYKERFLCGTNSQLCIRDGELANTQCSPENICCVIFF